MKGSTITCYNYFIVTYAIIFLDKYFKHKNIVAIEIMDSLKVAKNINVHAFLTLS